MDDRIILTLPEREDFLRRLKGISVDGYTHEWLISSLMEMAGQSVSTDQLALDLFSVVAASARDHIPHANGFAMRQVFPLIDVLIDDTPTREAIRRGWYAATDTSDREA